MRVQTLVSFGSGTTNFPLIGVSGLSGTGTTERVPMPWPAVMRNLVLYSGDTARAMDCTLTLMKEGVATALEVTLDSAATTPVTLQGVDVSFATLEDCALRFATSGASGGNTFAWCIEIESAGNIYGIPNFASSALIADTGAYGGALGNGFQQSYVAPAAQSTSYSITAVAGTITTLVMRCYSGAPPGGESWLGFVRINEVIQDGSGGTVDTRCTITSGNTTASVSFVLPITPPDRVELVYVKLGGSQAGAFSGHVGFGIGFVPAQSGHFMLTGGSNQTLTHPGYVWPLSAQNETDELLAQAPVGPGGFTVRGLYIEAPAPGSDPDDQVTRWLRKSGVSTAITVVLTHLQTSGLIAGVNVRFIEGDYVSIFQNATGGSSPDSSRLYWGLAFAPVTDGGIIGPLAWIHWPRRLP